jgi:hypothetical protein
MLEIITLVASITAAAGSVIAIWQRSAVAKAGDARLAIEQRRIDHLLELLARKEAPVEHAQYMADKLPDPEPLIPDNAVWDDEGLYWNTPEED